MTTTKEPHTEATAEQTRPRGRPRSEKARTAILAAAIELLLEQVLHAMSMDDAAQHAGVSKATIYRWWPSKELLALDALATAWATPTPAAQRDTGSLRGDLLAGFRGWLRQLKQKPYGRVIAGLVAQAQTDPEFARLYREHFVQPRRAATRQLLVRGIDRGEIPADTNLELTLDLLYGPVYHRLLHGHAPLTDRFAQQVIDTVLTGITPPETKHHPGPAQTPGPAQPAAGQKSPPGGAAAPATPSRRRVRSAAGAPGPYRSRPTTPRAAGSATTGDQPTGAHASPPPRAAAADPVTPLP